MKRRQQRAICPTPHKITYTRRNAMRAARAQRAKHRYVTHYRCPGGEPHWHLRSGHQR